MLHTLPLALSRNTHCPAGRKEKGRADRGWTRNAAGRRIGKTKQDPFMWLQTAAQAAQSRWAFSACYPGAAADGQIAHAVVA
jgi:hypothetical protein